MMTENVNHTSLTGYDTILIGWVVPNVCVSIKQPKKNEGTALLKHWEPMEVVQSFEMSVATHPITQPLLRRLVLSWTPLWGP